MADACGMAGGNLPNQGRGGEAKFHPVPWAKQGDLGSVVLKKGAATASYKAGSTVEMSWGIRYNHVSAAAPLCIFCRGSKKRAAQGGGYQYRIAKADEPLTEAAFQKTPLKFAGTPKLRHTDGTETPFPPTYVTEGTTPAGSTWAMNPVRPQHAPLTSSDGL